MFYDELSLLEAGYAGVQQRSVATTSPHLNVQIASRIKMIIGSWYLDEFGNQAREIKARD